MDSLTVTHYILRHQVTPCGHPRDRVPHDRQNLEVVPEQPLLVCLYRSRQQRHEEDRRRERLPRDVIRTEAA